MNAYSCAAKLDWVQLILELLELLNSYLMRIFYITLNTDDEARRISKALLEQQLAVCTNWFPITCAYRWEGKIVDEPETVLIVKTQAGYRPAIEKVVQEHINYTNLIVELTPQSVNERFLTWLNTEVPLNPR